MVNGRLDTGKETSQHNTVTLYPHLTSNYTTCHRRFNGLAAMEYLQKRTVRPEFEFCNTSGLLRLFMVLILAESTFSCGPGPIRPGPPNPRVPMRLYQKFPDQHEMSKSASGRSEGGRVRRGSPAFKALVDNYSPDIIFKGDKNQDDRRMTKRCSEKLKILADKVKQRWPKVQLRVIEAYSDGGKGKHEKNSLHYEGRAVDITTSDKDRKKYGMLGRLAYEAGFDWVYYGWKNHIHASVKTDKGAQDGMGCFPGSASVLLENGQRVNMEELRIGDKVQSVDKRGNVVFSPVMLFMDYRPKFSVDFMLIETDKPNRKLAITGTHLIYQLNKQTRRESVVFARDTHAGDFVYISSGTNSKNFTAGSVSRVVHKTIRGVYAPLTEQGNIVVDDILCSCYAIVDHDLAHWCFAPVRFVVNIFPNFLKWFENGSEGIHWYARFLRQIYPIWEYVESFQTH